MAKKGGRAKRRRLYAVTGYGKTGRRETRIVQAENRNLAVEGLDGDEPFIVSRVDCICVGFIVALLLGAALGALGVWLYMRAA